MVVALETAKLYLRVDSSDDDLLIQNFILSAERICKDIIRVESDGDLPDEPEIEIAVLYAVAYLYEHREEADHKQLLGTLRSLLFTHRKEVF